MSVNRVTSADIREVLHVAVLFPVDLIIVALTLMNLEKAVFELMAGRRSAPSTPNDTAYANLVGLTAISNIGLPVLFVAYSVAMLSSDTP
jgi:hypothetical protein